MNFKSLQIENFLSISSASVDFTSGVHFVQGRNHDMSTDGVESNGSGKSALCGEAIEWVIWGSLNRSPRIKADDVVNRSVGKDCLVRIKFEALDDEWEVLRTRKHSEHGNSLRWWRNGVEKTNHDANQTKRELIEALPISNQVFRHAIQVGQGMPFTFLSLTETEKLDLLCEILSLDHFDQALEKAKEKRSTLNSKVITLEAEVENLRDSMAEFESLLSGEQELLVEAESKFVKDDSLETEIDSLVGYLATEAKEIEGLRGSYTSLTEQHKSLSSNLLYEKERRGI